MDTQLTIEELEAFFNAINLPPQIRLHKSILITDVPLFVKGHLAVIKEKGIEIGGFYDRLLAARAYILANP